MSRDLPTNIIDSSHWIEHGLEIEKRLFGHDEMTAMTKVMRENAGYSDSLSWLRYHLEYESSKEIKASAIIFSFFSEKRIVATWSMEYMQQDENLEFGIPGLPVRPPIFLVGTLPGFQEKVMKAILSYCNEIARTLGKKEWTSEEVGPNSGTISQWQILATRLGAKVEVGHELYIDLSMDFQAIRSNFRKSYKSLINLGMRTWNISILDTENVQTWEEVKLLHLQVAGRQTRSDETWAIQLQEVSAGLSFVVLLRSSEGELVGAAIFSHNLFEGTYFTGIYKRELFNLPLGHVVQLRAIEELQRRGLRWYKLGDRGFLGSVMNPSEKEISIGYFKEGFATHVFPRYRLRHQIS